jgi:glutamine cyclotransferase
MKKQDWINWMILFFVVGCQEQSEPASQGEVNQQQAIPVSSAISYTVLNAFPHDTAAFTQGLEYYKGQLLESTGLTGRSSLRAVDISSGKVTSKINLDQNIFAEGLTVLRDTLYQLSWQNHEVYLWDVKKQPFKKLATLPWSGEGWGITNDGNQLIISEGSDKLYFVQPGTLKLNKVLSIRDQYGAVNNLNELEIIGGYIYANRWQYDYILKIDPATGFVAGLINLQDFLVKNSKADLSYLSKPGTTATDNGAVLNGIAFNPEKETIYITGKLWPEVFEIRIE